LPDASPFDVMSNTGGVVNVQSSVTASSGTQIGAPVAIVAPRIQRHGACRSSRFRGRASIDVSITAARP
jgi:hypothetical protein